MLQLFPCIYNFKILCPKINLVLNNVFNDMYINS